MSRGQPAAFELPGMRTVRSPVSNSDFDIKPSPSWVSKSDRWRERMISA